jgi:4'-phosphopantetheinyl transferase
MDGSLEYFEAAIKSLQPVCGVEAQGVEDGRIDDAVRVFCAEIPDAYFAPRLDWLRLCAAVRCRLDQLTHPGRRAQFAAGRVLLRHAIERTFGAAAEAWQIETLATGGVRLTCGASFAPASISHSGPLVACAIASRGRVGIDIEQRRARSTPWRNLAGAVLHPAELDACEALDEPDRWLALYRHWTFKEALAKALGLGLGLGFERVCFAPGFRAVEIEDTEAQRFRCFGFAAVDCGAHAVGAVAWCPQRGDVHDGIERRKLQ